MNENSVLEGWVGGRLVGKDVDKADTWSPIPVSYAEELTDLFNAWLAKNRPAETVAAIRVEAGVAPGGRVPRLAPPEFGQASPARFRAEAEFYIKCPPARTRRWSTIRSTRPSPSSPARRPPAAGRVFTISEVNHPFPHETACEGFPILTAYAMFQDWDGIYWFTWDNGKPSKDGGIPPRAFFTLTPDPVKIANLMACGALWHQGGIAPATQTAVRSYTREQIVRRSGVTREFPAVPFLPGIP